MPILSTDNDQLVTFLTNQGYIRPEMEEDHQQTVLDLVLGWIREVCKSVPPHLQIWSYAWLCLPVILSLMKNAALNN